MDCRWRGAPARLRPLVVGGVPGVMLVPVCTMHRGRARRGTAPRNGRVVHAEHTWRRGNSSAGPGCRRDTKPFFPRSPARRLSPTATRREHPRDRPPRLIARSDDAAGAPRRRTPLHGSPIPLPHIARCGARRRRGSRAGAQDAGPRHRAGGSGQAVRRTGWRVGGTRHVLAHRPASAWPLGIRTAGRSRCFTPWSRRRPRLAGVACLLRR